MFGLRKPLAADHAVAARRSRKLRAQDLVDSAHNSMTTISRSLRNGELTEAEEYAEVLLVIIRELKSRD